MVSIRLLSGAYFGNIKQLAKSDQLPDSKLKESHLQKGRKRALNSIFSVRPRFDIRQPAP